MICRVDGRSRCRALSSSASIVGFALGSIPYKSLLDASSEISGDDSSLEKACEATSADSSKSGKLEVAAVCSLGSSIEACCLICSSCQSLLLQRSLAAFVVVLIKHSSSSLLGRESTGLKGPHGTSCGGIGHAVQTFGIPKMSAWLSSASLVPR